MMISIKTSNIVNVAWEGSLFILHYITLKGLKRR